MTINILPKSLSEVLPICRTRLYEDVVCSEKYGPVSQVWLSPGHTFVAVRDGKQILTFDTKTTNKAQDENIGCLDIAELDSPVVNILVSGVDHNISYIVQQNGHVQCWKFRADLTWVLVHTFDICISNRATVISICLNKNQHALFWCEKRLTSSSDQPSYCVCKRSLPNDESKISEKELGPVQAILHNCPPCQVFPTQLGLAVVIQNVPPLVSMVIVWSSLINSVSVYVGPHKEEINDQSSSQAIDFLSVASKVMGITTKMENKHIIKGVAYNTQTCELVVLEEDGRVQIISDTRGREAVSIQLDVGEKIDTGQCIWLEYFGVLGVFSEKQLRLFDIRSGRLKTCINITDFGMVQGLCNKCPDVLLPGFFTKTGIYLLMQSKKLDTLEMEGMLKTDQFQTMAVHLAYLEQVKSKTPSTDLYQELSQLHQRWDVEKERPSCTKLAEIVRPYLDKYWLLEELQQNILMGKLQSVLSLCSGDVEEEVMRVLSPETNMSMPARQAWLLVLADTYPEQVLKVLESKMDFETDDIGTAQIQRWQGILGQDNSLSPVSKDVAVPMFEHICRLLFKIQPSRLVHFVKICQMINDQRVGVSAFIRKRHAVIYYERAVTSIQEFLLAPLSDDAIVAYVQLLLASKQDNCEVKALKCYMGAEQWDLALELLKQFTDNPELHPKLFHLLLCQMKKENVLSQYAEQIFSLMPEIKSFSGLSSVICDGNSVSTAKDVFCQTEHDISLGTVKPIFEKKLSSQRTSKEINKMTQIHKSSGGLTYPQ